MSIKIRKMKKCKEDVQAVIAIDGETFKECSYSWEELLEKIDFDQYPIFLAESEDIIVGFICFMKVQTLHYSGLWVDLVAVAPSYGRQGIAKQLIQVGQGLAEDLGVDFSSALVREDNVSSTRAFEAQGFEWDNKKFRLYFK